MKGVILLASATVATLLYTLKSLADQTILSDDYRRTQIAEEINSQNLSWKASDYAELRDEISFKTGLLDGNSENLMSAHAGGLLGSSNYSPEQLRAVPDSFDARTAWPNCESIKDIRNQAKCGSCWAFSAATVMSDRFCIASGQKIQTRLAPQDVLTCCFSCGHGCSGGFTTSAWFYFINSGLVSGNHYGDNSMCQPYTVDPTVNTSSTTPQCKRTCVNGKNYFGDKVYAKNAYLVVGEEQMKAEVSTNGPISISITTYEDFSTYKTGVWWHKTGNSRGGHAMRLVGYGSEDGIPYWIVANTWGDKWGENGFIRIRRGTNECGIEAEGVAGLVDVPNA